MIQKPVIQTFVHKFMFPLEPVTQHQTQHRTQPSNFRSRCGVIWLVALLSLTSYGWTQQAAVQATARADTLGLQFAVQNVVFAGWRVNAHMAVREVLAGQLSATQRTTFGPIGSVQLAAEAGITSNGLGALTFSAAGNLGTVGARVGLLAYNAHPVAFDVRALHHTSRPYYAALEDALALGLELSGTYRLSRRVLVTASPTFIYLTDTGAGKAGVGGRLHADVTWRQALATDNVSLLLASELHPAGHEGFVALAGQYQLARRGLPLVTTSLWLAANDGIHLGARVAASGRPGTLPIGYEVTLAAEPFQITAPAYRASLAGSLPLHAGTLELNAVTAWGERADVLELDGFSLSFGYAFDF